MTGPARADPRFARVAVVGTSGAGKTALARRLAAVLDAPHVELDALHWGPAWTPAPTPVFRARVAHAVAAPRWVCDGNYRAVRDLVWARATAVVWLDYGLAVVMRRVLGRTLRRGLRREALWAGNRESLRQAFLSRDSILWWALSTWADRRRRYGALFEAGQPAGAHRVRLRRPADAERLVRSLARRAPPGRRGAW